MAPSSKDDDGDKEPRHCLKRQLRKTKLCEHHKVGKCQFGDRCTFAHDQSEIQEVPDLAKTRLCKAFMDRGWRGCDRQQCTFAHGEEELRSTDLFFKRTLCIWFDKGTCRSGDNCRFAHGEKELRESAPPSKGSDGHPKTCGGPCKFFLSKRGCLEDQDCEHCHICGLESSKKRKRSRSQDRVSSKRRRDSSLDDRGARTWDDFSNCGPPPGSQAYEAWRQAYTPGGYNYSPHPAVGSYPAPAYGYASYAPSYPSGNAQTYPSGHYGHPPAYGWPPANPSTHGHPPPHHQTPHHGSPLPASGCGQHLPPQWTPPLVEYYGVGAAPPSHYGR